MWKDFFKKYGLLIFILVVAFLLRINGVGERQLGTDEDHSLYFSRLSVNGSLGEVLATEPHPPGYYFILGFLLKVYDSEVFLRVVTVLIGVLGILVTYFLARELSGKESVGILTALLLAINPMHLVYSLQLRSYILVSLVFMIATYCLYGYIFKGKGRMVYFLGMLYVVLFYLHFYSVFLIAMHVLTVVLWRKRVEVKDFGKSLGVLLIGVIAYVPVFLRQLDYTLIQEGHLPYTGLRLIEIPYPFFKFAVMVNASVIREQFGRLGLLVIIIFAAMLTFFCLAGAWKWIRESENGKFAALMFFGVFVVSLVMNPVVEFFGAGSSIYYFRYFTYLVPLYVMFIVKGIEERQLWVRILLYGLIIVGWLVMVSFYYQISESANWGAFIAT